MLLRKLNYQMKKNSLITQSLISLALTIAVAPAYALKFEIPKELQAQVDAEAAAKAEEPAMDFTSAPKSEPVAAVEFETIDNFTVSNEVAIAANEGRITGRVVDKETGAPVGGVAILLEGADSGTVTNDSGDYSIQSAPEGVYTLSFIKSGYIEASVTDFAVVGGEEQEFAFALPPRPVEMSDDVYELQDFSVTAEEANQLMMNLDLQKLSVTQLDVLSADEFSKYAASDMAEAVKNIAGVSLSDGKYAVIRGLNDRYSVTRLNGVNMPSPDPDRAAVPLDMFPTGIFAGIETRKTNSPDLPGEASGGVIDLKLLGMAEERILKFSIGTGFNTNSQDDWLTTPRSGTADYFGSGADDRDFDEDYNSSAGPFDLSDPGQLSEFISVQQPGGSNSSIKDLLPKYDTPRPDFNGSVLYSESWRIDDRQRFGLTLAASQRSKSRYTEQEVTKLGGNATAGADPVFGEGDYIVNEWGGTRSIGAFEGQISGLVGLAYELDERHLINANVLATRTGIETSIINEGGTAWGDGGQNSSVTFDEAYDPAAGLADTSLANGQGENYIRTSYNQRTLLAYILTGQHDFDRVEWLDVDWSFMYAYTEQLEPDTFDTRGPLGPYRIKRETTQDSYGANALARIALDELFDAFDVGRGTDFEFGATMDHSERDFEQSQKHTESGSSLEFEPNPVFYYNSYFVDDGVTGEASGTREIDALYGMIDTRPNEWLQIVAGARYEETQIEYDGYGSAPQAGEFSPELVEGSPIDQGDWIPSINVNFDITETLKLRLAYSDTIARPTYRELQPFPVLNPYTNEIEVGNAGYMAQVSEGAESNPVLSDSSYWGLEVASVSNADIRLEWYPAEGSFYALGCFVKEVGSPIERIEASGQDSTLPVFTYVNNENDAEMYGVEFEWQQNVGQLFDAAGWEFLNIGGNCTYIDAEVERSEAELVNAGIEGIAIEGASKYRPLYDQPDVIANLFVNLSFEETGSDVTLSLNHTGERLTGALSSGSSDTYEEAVTTLNLVYTQEIRAIEGLKLKFAVKNLTDPTFRRVTKGGDNDILIRDEAGNVTSESDRESYSKGISFSLSANYEF